MPLLDRKSITRLRKHRVARITQRSRTPSNTSSYRLNSPSNEQHQQKGNREQQQQQQERRLPVIIINRRPGRLSKVLITKRWHKKPHTHTAPSVMDDDAWRVKRGRSLAIIIMAPGSFIIRRARGRLLPPADPPTHRHRRRSSLHVISSATVEQRVYILYIIRLKGIQQRACPFSAALEQHRQGDNHA